MADRVGQQLGNYRLVRLLGKGGFAEVYLGEHLRLGTQAAIKVLHTRLARGNEVEGFQNEARTIARLEHPHIVRVLDFDVEEDVPFLVMGYASNGSLRDRHPKGTSLPLSTIIHYIKQIAAALQYAHDEKLIHRDIKPENMLVGRHAEVLLSDFGIAVIAHSEHSLITQNMAGTVPYMAPEQLQGKPRLASDQYALGVIVYEWLCGERPFNGTAAEIAMQHISTPPPSLREKVPFLSSAIEQVILRALAKDPQERFASIQAFASALEQAKLMSEQDSSSHQSIEGHSHPMSGIPLNSSSAQLSGRASSHPASRPLFPISPSDSPSIHSIAVVAPNSAVMPAKPATTLKQEPLFSVMPSSHTSPPSTPFGSASSSTHAFPSPNTINGLDPSTQRATPLLPPQPTTISGRRSLSKSKVGILIVLVFIVVTGSVGLLYTKLNNHSTSNVTTTITANAQTTANARVSATANARVTATAIANEAMLGFYAQHTHFNPYENVLNPANVSHLVMDWTTAPIDTYLSSPAVVNGVVYVSSGVLSVSSQGPKLYAFNASSGKTMWTVTPGGTTHFASPAVANGVVYVGSDDHKLYAFNASTGKGLWTASTGGSLSSLPTIANSMVYIGSLDANLYAFNASTGKLLWSSTTGAGIDYSSTAVANGVVYVGSDDHKLYAFNASTGKTIWTATADAQILYSAPAVANGIVYIGSINGTLYAFNASTGKTIWTFGPTTYAFTSSPAVANGVVYVGNNDYKLRAFDASKGKLLWKVSTGFNIETDPVVANGVVYVSSMKLFAFHLPSTSP